jgi:hypothetical protein
MEVESILKSIWLRLEVEFEKELELILYDTAEDGTNMFMTGFKKGTQHKNAIKEKVLRKLEKVDGACITENEFGERSAAVLLKKGLVRHHGEILAIQLFFEYYEAYLRQVFGHHLLIIAEDQERFEKFRQQTKDYFKVKPTFESQLEQFKWFLQAPIEQLAMHMGKTNPERFLELVDELHEAHESYLQSKRRLKKFGAVQNIEEDD